MNKFITTLGVIVGSLLIHLPVYAQNISDDASVKFVIREVLHYQLDNIPQLEQSLRQLLFQEATFGETRLALDAPAERVSFCKGNQRLDLSLTELAALLNSLNTLKKGMDYWAQHKEVVRFRLRENSVKLWFARQ